VRLLSEAFKIVLVQCDDKDFSRKNGTDIFTALNTAKEAKKSLTIEVNGSGTIELSKLESALEGGGEGKVTIEAGDTDAKENMDKELKSSMITLAEILVDFLQKFSLFVSIDVQWPSLFMTIVEWLAVFTFKFDLMFPVLSSLWIEYGILISTLAIHPLMITYMYYGIYTQSAKRRWQWEQNYGRTFGKWDVILVFLKWVVPVGTLLALSVTIAKTGASSFASYPIMIALSWSCLWLLFVFPNLPQAYYYRWCCQTHKDENVAKRAFWAALAFVNWRLFWFLYAASYLAPVKVILQICFENAALKGWVIVGICSFWISFFFVLFAKTALQCGGDSTEVREQLRYTVKRVAAVGTLCMLILTPIMGVVFDLKDEGSTPGRHFLLWMAGFAATPWTVAPPLILWYAAYTCHCDVGIVQSRGIEAQKTLERYRSAVKAKAGLWTSVRLEVFTEVPKEKGPSERTRESESEQLQSVTVEEDSSKERRRSWRTAQRIDNRSSRGFGIGSA
jgi:hypothetical protein